MFLEGQHLDVVLIISFSLKMVLNWDADNSPGVEYILVGEDVAIKDLLKTLFIYFDRPCLGE